MSLKIPQAYRIRDECDPWDVLMRVRRQARREVRVKLLDLMRQIRDALHAGEPGVIDAWNRLNPKDPLDEDGLRDGMPITLLDADRYLHLQYGAQLRSAQINPFDFDTSIVVRRFQGWLIQPFTSRSLTGCLDFLDHDLDLVDYRYQNQSDPPDPLPPDWNQRARVWNAIVEDHWQDYLMIEVLSFGQWLDVSPAWDEAWAETVAAVDQGVDTTEALRRFL